MSDALVGDASFTVGICTINRRSFLEKAVAETLRQLASFPNGRLHIIDNGSSDGTPTYLATIASTDPRVRWFSEERRGAYYARAKAIDSAEGSFLIFLDDDALPQDGWLRGLLEGLVTQPTVGILGCGVDPIWEKIPPTWMSPRLMATLAIVSRRGAPVICKFPSHPLSISLGVRLNSCAALYIEKERRENYLLGRTYSSDASDRDIPLGGEETDLCEIYARNGYKVVLDPSIRVFHQVPAQRVTADWLNRKFEGDGRSRIRLLRVMGFRTWGRFGYACLLSLPIFAVLRAFKLLMPGRLCALVEAYYHKCKGAWSELLFGPRVRPLRYNLH